MSSEALYISMEVIDRIQLFEFIRLCFHFFVSLSQLVKNLPYMVLQGKPDSMCYGFKSSRLLA